MCSDAPDTSGVNAAAQQSAKLGQDAFDWFKQQYADTAGDRAATTERANAVSDAQLAATKFATQQAQDLDTYNKSTFRPVEQSLVTDAQNYDTPERRNQAAATAVNGINQQVAAQRTASMQDLARSGVAPDSMKTQAIMEAGNINAAKAAVGADAAARQNIENQGHARMVDAASLGRNLPAQQATQQQIASTTGNSAVANSSAALGAATSGASLMQTGFNTGIAGAQTAGNLFGQQAQLSSGGGSDLAGMGSLMGGAANLYKSGIFSSKTLKTDKRAVSMSDALASDESPRGERPAAGMNDALSGIKNLNVQAWRYKDGEGDGGEHIGPYAEDVQREFGDRVAPGGKMIQVGPMNDVSEQAHQQLLEQFARVQQKLALLTGKRHE